MLVRHVDSPGTCYVRAGNMRVSALSRRMPDMIAEPRADFLAWIKELKSRRLPVLSEAVVFPQDYQGFIRLL
jgi:hypothetical protein